jgi:hypothetical protein
MLSATTTTEYTPYYDSTNDIFIDNCVNFYGPKTNPIKCQCPCNGYVFGTQAKFNSHIKCVRHKKWLSEYKKEPQNKEIIKHLRISEGLAKQDLIRVTNMKNVEINRNKTEYNYEIEKLNKQTCKISVEHNCEIEKLHKQIQEITIENKSHLLSIVDKTTDISLLKRSVKNNLVIIQTQTEYVKRLKQDVKRLNHDINKMKENEIEKNIFIDRTIEIDKQAQNINLDTVD